MACDHCKTSLIALAAADAVLKDCMDFTAACADAFLRGDKKKLLALSAKDLTDMDTRAKFALDAIRKLAKEIQVA